MTHTPTLPVASRPPLRPGVPMTGSPPRLNRRRIFKGAAARAAAGALGKWSEAFAQAKLTVGVIYVGPRDDYGYNQAQAQGAASLKKMPGVTVVEQEKVPETLEVQKAMSSMIEQDGATLVFATSFGYF